MEEVPYRIGNYSIVVLRERSSTFACGALLIVLILVLVLNSLVFLPVLFSPLRSTPYNVAIASITSVSIFEALFNITSSVVFHASRPEDTVTLCRINATTLHFAGMQLSFSLALLLFDRKSVLFNGNQKLSTVVKLAIPLSVLASAVTSLPLEFGLIRAVYFENRMSCGSMVPGEPVRVTVAVLIIITHITIWCLTARWSYIIIKKVLQERKRISLGGEIMVNAGLLPLNNQELPTFTLSGLLVTSFFLAVVPNVFIVQISQFRVSFEIFDSIFSWTRFGFHVFSPIVILLLSSDIRKKCLDTFCFLPSQSLYRTRKNRKRKTKSVANSRIPVLFSTSDGIHLRTTDFQDGELTFCLEFCDLIGEEAKLTNPQKKRPKLNETFIIHSQPIRNRSDSGMKPPNSVDTLNRSRSRGISTDLEAHNKNSVLFLSQRICLRD